jgi:glycine cleavage system H protein
MAIIQGCELPDGLLYYIERSQLLWIRPEGEGIRIGATDPAQARAGRILVIRIRGAGTVRERGRPLATVESGKWAGPVMAPVSGTITASNTELEANPGLLNSDPYGRGWVATMHPSKASELDDLLRGEAALKRFREIIEREHIVGRRGSG